MEKEKQSHGLMSGDIPLIAQTLSVAEVTVRDVLKGRRCKRQTMNQVKINQAANFCSDLNTKKQEYIQQLAESNSVSFNNL
jgi:hypothetical protein